jgi:hypothetical protein
VFKITSINEEFHTERVLLIYAFDLILRLCSAMHPVQAPQLRYKTKTSHGVWLTTEKKYRRLTKAQQAISTVHTLGSGL